MEEGQGTDLANLNAGDKSIEEQKNTILTDLAKEDSVLLSARGVKGSKVELTFAEHVTNTTRTGTSNPLVALLNKSDDRFSSNKPRQGWITGMKEDILEQLGLDVSAINEGDEIIINKLNPELGGERLGLQVIETVKADKYQAENIDTKAKRAGKDGEYILHNGMYVFSNTYVVPSTGGITHTWLKADASVEGTSATGISAAPASGVAAMVSAADAGLAQ